MKEINNDIWYFYQKCSDIVIPVCRHVKRDGALVMGRGLARQARLKFPRLPFEIGDNIKKYGSRVFYINDYHMIIFPVKRWFDEKATLQIIEKSAKELSELFPSCVKHIKTIYISHVGCGNGGLSWTSVKPILEKYLDGKNFVICDNGRKD